MSSFAVNGFSFGAAVIFEYFLYSLHFPDLRFRFRNRLNARSSFNSVVVVYIFLEMLLYCIFGSCISVTQICSKLSSVFLLGCIISFESFFLT